MLIDASVRPRNMKRNISTKELCKTVGFKEEVGLSQMVGRLDLSGEGTSDFGLLWALLKVLNSDNGKIEISVGGKKLATWHKP